MSDDLALIESLGKPTMEVALTAAMRGIAVRITERPEIVRALTAAEQLQPGYVIADDTQAAEIADLVAQVIDGEKSLKAQTDLALRIPKQMEAAVRGAVVTVKELLSNARETGNAARVAYQTTLRRRAAEAEEKARLEAQEAARRAAEQAAETGGDIPPEAEVAPIEVSRTVSGGVGRMGLQVRIEPIEVVDFAVVPYEWLALIPVMARTAFSGALKAGAVKKPEPGESIVWKGVRFEARESAVNRRG